MPKKNVAKGSQKKHINAWLGNYPGKTLHRLGTTIVGVWMTSLIINLIWPLPDQVSNSDSLSDIRLKNLPVQTKPISILILGVSNSRTDSPIEANPKVIKGNLKSLLLLKSQPNNPIRILEFPTNLKIVLPGTKAIRTMAQVYEEGGVALSSDVVSKLLVLLKAFPQRYLILEPGFSSNWINLDKFPNSSLDKSLKSKAPVRKSFSSPYNDDQLISADGLEKIIFHDDIKKSKMRILKEKEAILKNLWEQLKNTKKLSDIKSIIKEVINSTKTNLTERELIDLALASIRSKHPPTIKKLQGKELIGNLE